jgi:hypothetical protein
VSFSKRGGSSLNELKQIVQQDPNPMTEADLSAGEKSIIVVPDIL